MRSVFVVLLLIVGCGKESGDDGGGGSDGTSSTSAPTSTGGAADVGSGDNTDDGDCGSGDATMGGSEDAASESTGSADDEGSSGASGGGSTDEGGGACDPDTQPNGCLMCVAPPCCNQLNGCNADEACACVLDCHVTKGNSIGSCKSQCDADDASVDLYNGVFFCGQMSCLNDCDWDVG